MSESLDTVAFFRIHWCTRMVHMELSVAVAISPYGHLHWHHTENRSQSCNWTGWSTKLKCKNLCVKMCLTRTAVKQIIVCHIFRRTKKITSVKGILISFSCIYCSECTFLSRPWILRATCRNGQGYEVGSAHALQNPQRMSHTRATSVTREEALPHVSVAGTGHLLVGENCKILVGRFIALFVWNCHIILK